MEYHEYKELAAIWNGYEDLQKDVDKFKEKYVSAEEQGMSQEDTRKLIHEWYAINFTHYKMMCKGRRIIDHLLKKEKESGLVKLMGEMKTDIDARIIELRAKLRKFPYIIPKEKD